MTVEIEELVECAACGEGGLLGDEVFFYDLPMDETEGGPTIFPFCLDCGPEENYDNLMRDED
jgi:hypothetical protein